MHQESVVAVPARQDAAQKITLPAQEGLTAQADGVYTVDGLTLAYGEERALSLTATLPCAVRGTVTENSAAAPGLNVTLQDAGGASQTAQTDAQGAYAFEALSAGAYQLTLQLPANKAIVTDNGQAAQGVGSYAEALTLAEGDIKSNQLAMEATASITGQIEALGEGQDISAQSSPRPKISAGCVWGKASSIRARKSSSDCMCRIGVRIFHQTRSYIMEKNHYFRESCEEKD